jgi:hypothetical protein
LADLGTVCIRYQDETIRNVGARRIQCDEIWRFCHAKAKNVPAEKQGVFGYGDVWITSGRVHQTLRVTPAMEAGVSDHVWSVAEIDSLLNETRATPAISEQCLGLLLLG